MSLCKDCIRGVRHEGTPEGKYEQIAGVKSYVATPTGDYPKDKVILLLPDVFGVELVNTQLLADDFAANNNVKTVVPDYLNGDSIPPDALNDGKFDLMKWFGSHGPAETRPPLDKVVAALKADGVTSLGATGYCYGGRYVFDLAYEKVISVSVVNHPSLLKNPVDLEKYRDEAKAPLLINSCTVDTQFPHEFQTKADEILGTFGPGYRRVYFGGCTHGFSVRGDLSDPRVKAGKEGAFKSAVEWFGLHL
ncbi:alpha/beta-hydrolase [Pluteus cervinus]|uniref:Alpha/beta-hydrolase n=1 Tax=Pluteus cervinus TaxID=181527 RepID=A0ACD3AVA1_9AGAR|nr:alpha/beta-hydrolase [Pluteus cervinus]